MDRAFTQGDVVVLSMDASVKSTLLDFIDDKKMEYGFNDEYEVNAEGQKLTLLWDCIYEQTKD